MGMQVGEYNKRLVALLHRAAAEKAVSAKSKLSSKRELKRLTAS